jgi:hypothetical protein
MIVAAVLEAGVGANLAAGHLQFHPQERGTAAAINIVRVACNLCHLA